MQKRVFNLLNRGFPGGSRLKTLPAVQETWVRSLGQEDPLGKKMATHFSTPAWEIPGTEGPGRLYIVHGVVKNWTGLCI